MTDNLAQPLSEKDAIHLAVGRALHEWEMLEFFLSCIFALLMQSPRGLAGLRAYGAVTNFSAHVDMLAAAAADYFLDQPHAEHTRRLAETLKIAKELAAFRNELAHGIAAIGFTDEVTWRLLPPMHNSRKHRMSFIPKFEYSAPQIDHLRHHFLGLASQADQLYQDMNDEKHRRRAASIY